MRNQNPLQRAKDNFRKAVTRTEIQSYEYATLGKRVAEDAMTFAVPGRSHHVYVTKSDGTVTIALNEASVPLNAFLPVKIRLENNTYVIKGQYVGAESALGNLPPDPSGVPPHTHDDRYYTETELNTSGAGGQVHWENVTETPATFPPDDHTHEPVAYEPLTNGVVESPELVFADGDVIMVEML